MTDRGSKRADRSSGGMFFAAPPALVAARPPGVRRTKMVPPHSRDSRLLVPSPPNQSDDALARQTLAFDELLRVQRARAEDVGKLISDLSPNAEHSGRDREKRAAKYREEWRVGREDQVLERICSDGEEPFSTSEQERLRSHVRRSIHLFLSSGGAKAKRSNDLFYAQQMDRLQREIDRQDPFTVVRQAISDARVRFQQLLLCGEDTTSQPTRDQDVDGSVASEEAEPAVPEMLALYENVVDAKAKAQPPLVKNEKRTMTPRFVESSAAFVENLQRQREEMEQRATEALAQLHWRRVCANRIRASYLKLIARRRRLERLTALLDRTQHRAAVILQTSFLRVVLRHRALNDAKILMTQKHQRRRISVCCFWRWIYPTRCRLSAFEPSRITPLPADVKAVIIVQSLWRRRRAIQETRFRRAFRTLRARRRRQREWSDWRRRSQATAAMSLKLAEWNCHVAIEKARVARELDNEQDRFSIEWVRYASRLEKDVMKARLSSEWIPQLDQIGGETFYLNVQTAKTSSEHPNRILLKQLLRKQRARAEQLYEERRRRLETYVEQLDGESEAFVEQAFARLHAALRAHET